MTLQDLKNNRDEIIERLNKEVGSENVKYAMLIMADYVSVESSDSTIDELFDSMDEHELLWDLGKKDNSLAAKMANAHEDETYNHLNKTWEAK